MPRRSCRRGSSDRASRRLVVTIAVAATLAITSGAAIAPAADAPHVRVAQRGGRGRSRGGAGSGVPSDARTLVHARVTAVDRQTGHVVLDADGRPLEADFPRSVVADMKAGDVVFVTVNVINPRIAAVTGSITSVDYDKGEVTVRTASGPFTFPIAPDKLDEMKPGDVLLLKLELVDIGPSGAAPPPASPGPAPR